MVVGDNGTTNTGGGGGGGVSQPGPYAGGAGQGGSGIVIVRGPSAEHSL